jgi:hypothetical protein
LIQKAAAGFGVVTHPKNVTMDLILPWSLAYDRISCSADPNGAVMNEDSSRHNIKADAFNSSMLSKGDTYQFTFNTAGTFDYTCGVHPSMKGQIIVK